MQEKIRPEQIGFIASFVSRLFMHLKWLSVQKWLSLVWDIFKTRGELSPKKALDPKFIEKRAPIIELYIMSWYIIEIILMSISCIFSIPSQFIKWFSYLMAFLRIVEIMQVTINTFIFDRVTGRTDRVMASSIRTVVLSVINYLELMVCFGLVYSYNLAQLPGAGRNITGFYFSIVNQLTMAYGEVYPISWLRIIAVIQGLIGVAFIVLIFSFLVASLPSVRYFSDMSKTEIDKLKGKNARTTKTGNNENDIK